MSTRNMAEGLVRDFGNIAEILTNIAVVPHRPPSHPQVKQKRLKSTYARELSHTGRHTANLFKQNDIDLNLICGDKSVASLSQAEVTKKRKPSRTQSAKARLCTNTSDSASDKTNIFAYDGNLKKRPLSAHADNTSQTPELTECRWCSNTHNLDVKCNLEPNVYGYNKKQTLHTDTKSECAETVKEQFCNYKIIQEESEDEFLKLLDYDEDSELSLLPKSLHPLSPWLTRNVSQKYIGIDPDQCFVFIPSLENTDDELPIVPEVVVDLQVELPHFHKTFPHKAPEHKTYHHPWKPLPLEQHVCQHRKQDLECESVLNIYSSDGLLLHRSQLKQRTKEVVRQEIKELENLMKGIGDINGCSVIVQYQAEINKIQGMLKTMSGRIEEITRRDRQNELKNQPTDHCGLRAFYDAHDEVIEQIRQQHQRCMAELAILEREIGIKPEDCQFKYYGKHTLQMNNLVS